MRKMAYKTARRGARMVCVVCAVVFSSCVTSNSISSDDSSSDPNSDSPSTGSSSETTDDLSVEAVADLSTETTEDLRIETADYLSIEVSFPSHLRPYMQSIRNELVAQNQYESVSNIHSRGVGKLGMEIKIDIAETHAQYAFIDYQNKEGTTTIRVSIDATALADLLMAPAGALPPAHLNLSEAEVVEFYRWQLANVIPPDQINALQIGKLLASVEITAVLRTGAPQRSGNTYRSSANLTQLLAEDATLQVQARY